jgi:predicted nucleic acid-binding protein
MAKPLKAYIMADIILSAIRDNNLERHKYSKELVEQAKNKVFTPIVSELTISELSAMVDDANIETLKTVLVDLNPTIVLYTEKTHALAHQYNEQEEPNQEEPNQEEPEEEAYDEADELLDNLNLLKKKINYVHSKMSFEEIKQDLERDFAELDKRLDGVLSQLLNNLPD